MIKFSCEKCGQLISALRRLLLLACILLSDPCPAKTLYVDDDDAPAGGDGLHWTSAFCYLQDALAVAEPNDEIRVARGVYYPDRGENLAAGDRSATFELQSAVVLSGGYGGLSCEDPNRRDVDQYASSLCGDLLDNDLQGAGDVNDNSFQIMTAKDIEGQVVLDGFIVQGASENEDTWGCGVLIERSQVLIQNCRFEGNLGGRACALVIGQADSRVIECVFAGHKATAVALSSSDSAFERCVFEDNQGGFGGAVSSGAYGRVHGGAGSPSFLDCVFFNNRAYEGGAVSAMWGGRPTFRNCRFINNHASSSGGAIAMDGHGIVPVFHGCLFAGNQAAYIGGGLSLHHTRPLFEYCTFVHNQARDAGGAIYGDTDLALLNSILWYNRATEGPQICQYIRNEGDTLNARYCNIEGGLLDVALTGAGPIVWQHNLGHDLANHIPGFVDTGTWQGATFIQGDYYLKSQAGHWDSINESWVPDAVTSPCIDTGDPMSPIGREPFPNGGRVNMGAYGGTIEASKSYFGKPVCETIVAGDINGDCQVDHVDFAIMCLHWLECHDVDY